MGYGLVWVDLHVFADLLINKDTDECQHIPITKYVTEGLLLHHKDLVRVVEASSLNPKRVCQATVEEEMQCFLNLIPIFNYYLLWVSFGSPADSIYNMDELGNGMTKHQNKVLQNKITTGTNNANTTCTFMQTAESDGQMPMALPPMLMISFND